MAGHAAKKTAKRAESQTHIYRAVAGIALAVHIMVTFGIYRDFSALSLVGTGFLAGVTVLSYKMIIGSLELGLGPSYWQDLFIVNVSVELLSLVSRYFWVLYLTVPGYGVYKLGGQLLGWVFAKPPLEPTKAGKRG